ncbi:amidase [Peniophora sp. CONT]|nr:amidase [Peniophora sp. CONT]
MSRADWTNIVSEKRAALLTKIPAAWRLASVPEPTEHRNCVQFPRKFMSERAYAITETMDAQLLLNRIAGGEYTSLEVTEAFCHRAAIAQQLVNCLTEIMFDEALQRARELDDYLRTHKKTVGSLHGLPVSLKDSFRVRGTNSAIGLVAFLDVLDTPETESFIVKELRELGAVIYVKTTTPTAVRSKGFQHIDCHNNITGQTLSPVNWLMSSAGSSGGTPCEGALSAMHGSIVGLSTDIGGSSRVPAAVNGVYGLRTSLGRLPYLGVRDLINGNISSSFTVGPMGASLSNLKLLMQVTLSRQPSLQDPKVIELPWRTECYDEVIDRARTGGLVFGLLMSDGVVTPQPPVSRALNELQSRLEAAGHEIIPWTPPSHADAASIQGTIFVSEGGQAIHKTLSLSGEPPNQLVKDYFGEAPRPGLSASELFAANERRYQYQQAYAKYWNETRNITKSGRAVDFVLLPAFPASCFRPGQSGMYLGYTTIANCLDYTAAVLPVSRVNKTIDLPNLSFVPLDKRDQLIQSFYEPEDFDGSPIAVQIMGRRLQEEQVLAVASVIDELVRSSSTAASLL